MSGLGNYISDLLVGLGTQRRKLPGLVILFSLASILDLVGIGLVGGYISLLTKPEDIESHVLFEWATRTGLVEGTNQVIVGLGSLLNRRFCF